MPRRAPASLPYANWPPDDRIAWESALRDGGLFDERGAAAHWSERTRDSIRYDYGIWLLWCQGQGRLHDVAPGDRVTASAVAAYLTSMEDRIAPITRHIRMQRLHQLMVIFCTDKDWAWLRETVNRLPRLLRARDAPFYAGMDRNKFNNELRPHLTEIPLGAQAIAFDRIELDALIDDYISRNGRRPKASQLEDDICQNATKCRGSASKAAPGTSRNAVSTAKADGSGKARAHLAALKQKKS